jgi:hypothetical protein
MKINIVDKTIAIEEIINGQTLDEIIDVFMESGIENWRDYRIIKESSNSFLKENPWVLKSLEYDLYSENTNTTATSHNPPYSTLTT